MSARLISLSARMVRQKMGFSVKSNAIDEDTGAPLQVRMPAGAGQTARLNRKLARVDIRRRRNGESSPVKHF